MNKKNLLSFLGGLIASFVIGWLVYEVALKDYYAANTMAGVNKPESEYIWWAMLLSPVVSTCLYVYIMNLAGANTFKRGAIIGLWVSLLFGLSIDLYFYGGTNMMSGSQMICVDAIACAVQGIVVGGVIGWVRGMVDKPAAAAAA